VRCDKAGEERAWLFLVWWFGGDGGGWVASYEGSLGKVGGVVDNMLSLGMVVAVTVLMVAVVAVVLLVVAVVDSLPLVVMAAEYCFVNVNCWWSGDGVKIPGWESVLSAPISDEKTENEPEGCLDTNSPKYCI
jgi:hypothetical protein